MTTGNKFNLFREWVINQGVEISDKSNVYQCLDLAYSWVFFLNIPKATIQNLYAYEVYTKPKAITKQYFDLIPNTPDAVPHAGDLVVFDKTSSNIAGHIAVATGTGNTASFVSLDQNWNGQSRVVEVSHNYAKPKVLGWLRAKNVTSTTELPAVVTGNLPKVDLGAYGIFERQAIISTLTDKDKEISRLQEDNRNLELALQQAEKPEAVYQEATPIADPSETTTHSDTIDNTLPPIPENLVSDLFAWIGAWLKRLIGRTDAKNP
jgi:hypothetical protein